MGWNAEHYNYFRDYDPAIGRYVQSDPLGLAPSFNTYAYPNGPLGAADPFGLCRIELRFKPVPLFGRYGQHHAYIVTRDTNGNRTYFRGGPNARGRASSPVFGSITTEHKEYVPGTKDYQEEMPPMIVILDDDQPCECINKRFSDILDKIEARNIVYFPQSQNSNSVAGTALRDSGFKVGPLPVGAPGFGNNLRY